VTVEVDLTTNHNGYFEFKLCPVNGQAELENQECMDKYPLFLAADPTSSKYYIPEGTGKSANITYDVDLPAGLTCSQCVLQWTYFTGNTWGKCANGTEAIGCGDQETFRNCADVQILSNTPTGLPPNAAKPANAVYRTSEERPLVVRSNVCVPNDGFESQKELVPWCQENCLSYPPRCNALLCKCL
jgi:hypothetical protein